MQPATTSLVEFKLATAGASTISFGQINTIMRNLDELTATAKEVFTTAPGWPKMTLRGGNAIDDYRESPPFDHALDHPSDENLERYHWGVGYLDPESWRFYLPILIEYSLRNRREGSSMVIDATLNSLRPPDTTPPKFSSLTQQQEMIIKEFLDIIAFDEESSFKEEAMQVIEEYWCPEAIYRPKTEQVVDGKPPEAPQPPR